MTAVETCAAKRGGPRKAPVLWCVWFALLMGSPYAQYAAHDAGPTGASSMSKVFAWVALGLVAGVWLMSHPTVRRGFDAVERLLPPGRARRAAVALGVALSLLAVVPAWVHAAVCMWGGGPLWWFAADGESVAGVSPSVLLAFHGLLRRGIVLATLGSVFCGACGWGLFADGEAEAGGGTGSLGVPGDRVSRPGAPVSRPGDPVSQVLRGASVVLLAAAFGAGLLQPLAWASLLPHAELSWSLAPRTGAYAGWYWSAGPFGLSMLTVPVPSALMLLLACRLFLRWPAFGPSDPTPTVGRADAVRAFTTLFVFCLGILGFRMLGRVAPSLHSPTLWVALGATAPYLCCLAILMVRAVGPASSARPPVTSLDGAATPSREGVEREGVPSRGPGRPASVVPGEALTRSGRAYLDANRLTDQEVLVVCAAARGLSSAQAGDAMGISAATVREYRRRCRAKLGVAEGEDLLSALPAGSLAPADPAPGDGVPRLAPWLLWTGAFAGLFACCALVMLPFEGAVRWPSDVWATCFGVGAGLVAARLLAGPLSGAVRTGANRPVPISALLVVFALLVLAATVLSAHRLGLLGYAWPVEGGRAVHKAVVLSATALFTMGAAASFGFLVGCLGTPALSARTLNPGWRNPLFAAVALASALVAFLGAKGPAPWAAVLAVSLALSCGFAAALWASACRGLSTCGEDVASPKRRTPGIAHLAVVSLLAWTFGEIWRMQQYASLYGVLRWAVLAIVVAVAAQIWLSRRADLGALGCMVAGSSLVALGTQEGFGLAVFVSQAVAFWGLDAFAGGPRGVPRHFAPAAVRHPWHEGVFAAAFGVVGGALVTNAYGDLARAVYYIEKVFGGAAGLQLVFTVVPLVVCALVLGTCLFDLAAAVSEEGFGAAPGERERLEAFLVGRGLLPMQARAAVLLADGETVADVADALGCSRSTVGRARRDAYDALGVQTRPQFIAVLRRSLNA